MSYRLSALAIARATATADVLAARGFRWVATDDPEYARGDESFVRCFRKVRALAGR